jgi:hypothetical protein
MKGIVELLILIGGSRYFSYTVVINIQEVHPTCKRRKLQSLGVVVVIGLGKTSRIIWRYKVLSIIKCAGD